MRQRSETVHAVAAGARVAANPGQYPAIRPRRIRQSAWSRRLVAETTLSPADLIWPLFVMDGRNKRLPIASMPGVDRLTVDLVVAAAEEALALGIPAIALFPLHRPRQAQR